MEKLKTFFKTYYTEVIFGVFFVLLLGFLALPFLNVNLLFTITDESIFVEQRLSIYQLMGGGTFGLTKLKPDVLFILVFVFILSSGILFVLERLAKKDTLKHTFKGVSLVLIFTSIILLIVSEKILEGYDYLKGWTEDYIEKIDGSDFNLLGFSLDLVCLIGMFVIYAMTYFKEAKFSIQEMVEMAMLIAVALVLDKLKIQVGATGGSINFAGLPLFLIALRHGPLKAFISSSIIFGLLSCIIDGYGLQTFPFDYFIAFAGYLVPGLVYNILKSTILKKNTSKGADLGCMIGSLVVGCIAVMITRMVGSSISSYLYFMDYLSEDLLASVGNDKFLAILLYNISYIGPSAACSLAGCILLAKPMQMINARFPIKKEEVTE